MDITIGNVLAFLIILFAINGLTVGLGLNDQSAITKNNPFGQDVNFDNFNDGYQSGIVTVVGTEDPEAVDSATTDQSIITGVPFTGNITTQASTFKSLIQGILFGYASLIMMLPLGVVLTFVLIGIIGFIQFGALFYVLAYVFSIIRGGGGI
jgi:hypothetical protein